MKRFYNTYKFDIWVVLALIPFYSILTFSGIHAHDWQYWVLALFVIGFRFIGYKEGINKEKNIVLNNLLFTTFDIAATSELQTKHKLGDVEPGTFFSVVDKSVVKEIKEPMDKYLKVESNNAIKVTVWNMTKQKFSTLSNDLDVILYSCKSIYTPKIEEENKEDE